MRYVCTPNLSVGVAAQGKGLQPPVSLPWWRSQQFQMVLSYSRKSYSLLSRPVIAALGFMHYRSHLTQQARSTCQICTAYPLTEHRHASHTAHSPLLVILRP